MPTVYLETHGVQAKAEERMNPEEVKETRRTGLLFAGGATLVYVLLLFAAGLLP